MRIWIFIAIWKILGPHYTFWSSIKLFHTHTNLMNTN
jgi:hypothetical protein